MSRTPAPNAYLRRHRRRLRGALAPDETLLAASRVAFFGSANMARTPRVPGEPVFLARKAAYRRWRAESGPFPAAGPDFVLGVSDRRLLVWRTSKWWNLPTELAGDLALGRIGSIEVQRMVVSGVLTIRYRDGGHVLVEAPLVGRLRPLATAFAVATGR